MSFVKATRKKSKLKMCLPGPSGAGKSFTALRFAFALRAAGLGSRVAVIESEAGKINKYAGYVVDGQTWDFDVAVLDNFSPAEYVEKLELAHSLGFDIVVVDSISHEWQGKGGALEIVDRLEDRNKFAGWKTVTPLHNSFIDTILRLPLHVIATCRMKMDYVLEAVEKNGKTIQQPKKVGMGLVQRNGIEYEFEIVGEIDQSHILTVTKTICPLIDGKVVAEPGAAFLLPVIKWLDEGVEIPAADRFTSSLVSPAVVADLVATLSAGGVNVAAERDWILKKYGANEWTHLTPTQLVQYRERAEWLIGQAKAAADQLNGELAKQNGQHNQNDDRQTLQDAGNANLPLVELNKDVPTDAGIDAGPDASAGIPPTNGQGHDAPPYIRPAALGPHVDGGIIQLWEEFAHLNSFTQDQKMKGFEDACLHVSGGATKDIRQLSDAAKSTLEQTLVKGVSAIYLERGMAAACPY